MYFWTFINKLIYCFVNLEVIVFPKACYRCFVFLIFGFSPLQGLLRFWLLGSKIADYLQTNFVLINLVPQEKEKNIESTFRSLIKESENRSFIRITWEEIYSHLLKTSIESKDKETLIKYFNEKTVGYSRENWLQKAFTLE